ncbi:pyridoxamine 5'-phosphate oxidase family protein [Streptosporangiaceae bacterium NEAU-GS5]|nr:pyridoxamine 5'-phosphate oxidase family protein [Streptosporangiaceae bacterium NEAU-GS5]
MTAPFQDVFSSPRAHRVRSRTGRAVGLSASGRRALEERTFGHTGGQAGLRTVRSPRIEGVIAMSATPAALEVLSTQDCWELIGPGGVGRVAFAGLRGLTVLPVNYRVHDGVVVFRTRRGGEMEEDLRTGIKDVDRGIAFEIDRIDNVTESGWSVLLRGPAHLVTGDEPVPAGEDVRPWAGGTRDLHIQITPHEITGRRVFPVQGHG